MAAHFNSSVVVFVLYVFSVDKRFMILDLFSLVIVIPKSYVILKKYALIATKNMESLVS